MKEIGQILRNRREEKKLTLETISRKTRIPVKFLVALEEGDLSPFPAEVYYTGFLRSYARFLELDPDRLIQKYNEAKAPAKETAPPAENKPQSASASRTAAILIVIFVVLVVLAVIFSRSRQEGAPEQPPRENVAPPKVSTGTFETLPKQSTAVPRVPRRPAPPAAVPPRVSTQTAPSPQQGMLNLHMQITQSSWAKITADEVVVFEGTLNPGESRAWAARDGFNVIVGYAPGVTLTLNGKPVDVRGSAVQDVAEISLDREDANL